jgi:hypothetical protein
MHDKEEDLLFSKSLFLTVTLLLGCNKEEEDRIGNRGFCFRPVANPDVQTTFVVAAAVCILESVWLQRDVKEKRNARVLFSCFKSELWCTCFITKTEVLFFLICALKIVIFGREFSLSTFTVHFFMYAFIYFFINTLLLLLSTNKVNNRCSSRIYTLL